MGASKREVLRGATRITVSVVTAALLVAAPDVSGAPVTVPPVVRLTADSTVLALCGATCPTWRPADLGLIMDQFVTPTHPTLPGDKVTTVAVTAPGELWPLTGLARLLLSGAADPRLAGPGGGAWPDEPWWKLSGLFDLTANQSLRAGAAALEKAMLANPSEQQVIYGYSQGAGVANVVKRRLAAQYPGSTAPDVDFVLGGDPNLPNGGLMTRFWGAYIPILDFPFNGPTKTDTEFDTVEINRQYDGFADFPLYPLNLVATLNAIIGIAYVHGWPFDVSLPSNPTDSPAYQGKHGDTSYYFFESQDLPLFAPLRALGVPEKLIDVVEPVFRVLVELGYDRTIPAWQPTPARLIPKLNPVTVARDLMVAIGQGINNALVLVGLPPLLRLPKTNEKLSAPIDPMMKTAPAPQAASRGPLIAKAVTAVDLAAPKPTKKPADPVVADGSAKVDDSPKMTVVETVPETGTVPPPPRADAVEQSDVPAVDTDESPRRATTPKKLRQAVRDVIRTNQQRPARSHREDKRTPAATATASKPTTPASPTDTEG
ncbi:MAG: PE-PPE domain-containing protein [Mycolicibacterium cosmeticum]|nr:PE-PPE domain-containing protein [Mycolicibacterium cosmeticum]